jgi:dihydroxy-acid dehydratase
MPAFLRRFSTGALNRRSATITAPASQGASQAMLHATGLTRADMSKAQVGIASVWWEGNPCNMHLLDLSQQVKKGVEGAGLVGFRFNTVGVSDGISMGTSGMRYSLPSREVIADSVETVLGAQWYDGSILIPGCDKNMPGVVIGAARVNVPSIMVFGGTIRAGCTRGPIGAAKQPARVDIVSAFQAYGESLAGRITEAERVDIVASACPGAGACGGMYTANTMATAIEAMGMSLPYSSSSPADSAEKAAECQLAGQAIKTLLGANITPKDIMTREAFGEWQSSGQQAAQQQHPLTPLHPHPPPTPPRTPQRTPWLSPWCWGAPPMPCCTCWPWRTQWA